MIFTMTPTIEGKRIADYPGVMAGEAIIGVKTNRYLFASVRDTVGGDPGPTRYRRRKRNEGFRKLEAETKRFGENAVVGIYLDYEVVGQGGSMMMVAISGDAFAIED